VTTSVWRGVRKTHESGELIFEDNFDTLNFDMWQHEITMAGGGNWEFQVLGSNPRAFLNTSICINYPSHYIHTYIHTPFEISTMNGDGNWEFQVLGSSPKHILK
jgi:hypothetical protein